MKEFQSFSLSLICSGFSHTFPPHSHKSHRANIYLNDVTSLPILTNLRLVKSRVGEEKVHQNV